MVEKMQKNLSVAVNMTMVYLCYEAGRMIIEEEQDGKERVAYGKYRLKELSKRLTQKSRRGYSYDNLKLMRKFYLSCSHYLILMRISKIEERHFYEIEHIEMAGVKMN